VDRLSELDPGTTLETVLLGGFYDGILRIWRDSGVAECREPDDPDVVTSVLGRGMLARTSPEPNRFREVALLDAQHDLLVLLGRPTLGTDSDKAIAGGGSVAVLLSETTPATVTYWAPWAEWLGDIVGLAAQRSEYLVIETGGWEAIHEPYVLLGVFPGSNGSWTSVVEALPAPADPPWTVSAVEGHGSTLSAPANPANVAAGGGLAIQALEAWANSPLDVVVTFGRREPIEPWQPAS
jgi:hypothetical protein